MVEVIATVRKWGRSLGVVIPKEKAKEAHLKPGKGVRILILGREDPVQKTFGTAKFSRSTDEILKEVDREAWDD